MDFKAVLRNQFANLADLADDVVDGLANVTQTVAKALRVSATVVYEQFHFVKTNSVIQEFSGNITAFGGLPWFEKLKPEVKWHVLLASMLGPNPTDYRRVAIQVGFGLTPQQVNNTLTGQADPTIMQRMEQVKELRDFVESGALPNATKESLVPNDLLFVPKDFKVQLPTLQEVDSIIQQYQP